MHLYTDGFHQRSRITSLTDNFLLLKPILINFSLFIDPPEAEKANNITALPLTYQNNVSDVASVYRCNSINQFIINQCNNQQPF